jgi:hypothetical protein
MRFIPIFFLLFGLMSKAQYAPEYHVYKDKYPNAHSIRLNQETNIQIKLENGKIDVLQEDIEEDLYLDENAKYGSKKSLNFSSFFELEEIEASSFIYENKKYRETKVETFKEKDEINQSFYDDTKSLNFIYPNLRKGSKSKLKYSQKIKNPRFLSPFYFGDFQPVKNNKITIVADKDISLKFQEFNTEDLNISFTKQEKKGKITYTWQVVDTDEYEYEKNSPTLKKIIPHIVPIINSYVIDGETVNLLSDTGDLYNWYYSLVKDVNQEESDKQLVTLVELLTKDKKTDLEKVRAIYYWTQKNIKYIAFEYALGGFIPREANSVFKKKYGDCKDNSSILYKMLELAGLKGNLTWIGTRSIPYNYDEVPTPIVDNHMILSYMEGDQTYFLDATGRFTPLEYPSSFIQGKEALISIDDTNYVIKKVPVVPAAENAFVEVTNIAIEGEKIVGKSKVEISGYQKTDYLYALENELTDTKIKELYNVNLRKGNNKFLIKELEETNKYDYDKNLIISYSFNVDNIAKHLANEIYVNLNLNRNISHYKTKEDRKNEVEYDYKAYYSYTTTVAIPEGYEVDYIPENIEVANEYISAKIKYSQTAHQITYTHHFTLNFLNLNLNEQKEVNGLIKKIEKAFKEIIVFKKVQ